MVIDFDFVRPLSLNPNNYLRTHSVVGHPLYWAPELNDAKGYTCLVDLWSLGICLFVMTFGFFPFGDSDDDSYAIMNKIKKDPVKFPKGRLRKHQNYEDFISFLSQLLEKNPIKRLGGKLTKDYSIIKSHPFLRGFDFVRIMDQLN